MKAMILAAGEGTRLLPFTKDKPKALVKYRGTPILELLIHRLVQAGFKEIVINVYHYSDQIISFVDDHNGFGADVTFSKEDQLLDTGGGIKRAMPHLGNEPVLFHNIDILTNIDLKQLYQDHLSRGGKATLVVKDRPTSRSLLYDHNDRLVGWEHPEKRIRIISRKIRKGFRETAFSGIYILDPSLFESFPEEDVFSLTPWLIELSGVEFL